MQPTALYGSSHAPKNVGVVTSKAIGDGTVMDAGETGKEPDDHSGDAEEGSGDDAIDDDDGDHGGLRDNGVVESDGAVECDEVILVSDGSEASNSSSMRGETGVRSDEGWVWSDDGSVVLATSG
ncbi:hypothetical protein Tco_0582813 [Tanacetum coccineum]